MADVPEAPPGRGWIWLMAIACGLAVANLYFNQPLLPEMGRSFHAGSQAMGWIATLTQAGYAIGLFGLVPLGDMLERRRLIVFTLVLVALALAAVALAPSYGWLAGASLLVGATTIAPQLLIPFAAQLAPDAARGQIVGTLMGGLLIGILLARTASGWLGEWLGWRAVFGIAAVLMLALAAVLRWRLPAGPPTNRMGYGALLRSLGHVLREHPVLWEASAIGAALFGAFSAFWTTLAFRLAEAPYHLGARAAGLFGLVGVVGALAAPMAGKIADKRSPRLTVGLAIAIVILSFGVFAGLGDRLWGLALGVALIDLGVQSAQVSNQARIYQLPKALHSRLNTVYMGSYFIGGGLGSALGAAAWTHWGWPGVCGAGAALGLFALAAYFGLERAARREQPEWGATRPPGSPT